MALARTILETKTKLERAQIWRFVQQKFFFILLIGQGRIPVSRENFKLEIFVLTSDYLVVICE